MSTPANPWLARLTGVALAALVALADQALKSYLLHHTGVRFMPVEVLPVFRFTYVENYGVSLGLLTAVTHSQRWLLVALTGAIASGVLVWLLRERKRGDILALGLVLGGALGNIVDRVTRGFVVDYADLHFGEFRPFYIFNLADAGITIGVVILLLRSLLLEEDGTFSRRVRKWFARRGLGQVAGGEGKFIKDQLNG